MEPKEGKFKILTQDSKTDIVVNQPIHRMSHRTVKIEGEPSHIAQAIAMIYGLLEDRAEDFRDINEPVKPFNISTVKMSGRFVVDHKVVGFVIGRNGQFTKHCLEKYDVMLKIVDQKRFQKVVRSYEDVAILSGRLRDVQKCSELLIEKVNDYYNIASRSNYSSSENTQLLIPGYLVTKIIGAKGCMIREIASRSGGTQIKILSNKSAEKDLPEIVVSIAGNLKGKQDAATIILEQIELFKNGGPVLTTGSCLNENIATQYKNSVQGQEVGLQNPQKDSRRLKYSSSESSKRNRSRSSSLEERYTKRKDAEIGKGFESKNTINLKEINMIRAQLNSEFLNKQVPFPPTSTESISEGISKLPLKEILPSKSKNFDEIHQEDSKIPEILGQESQKVSKTIEQIIKPVEKEVRIEDKLDPKPLTKAKTNPIEKSPFSDQAFPNMNDLDSILNMKIQKLKSNFKLTLLFDNYSEGLRFKEEIDFYNKTSDTKIEYSSSDFGTSRSRAFTVKASPNVIAELIKIHGNKEIE